ncbi:MAG: BON domain-containing protein [Planctomycetaceae bacterium]
MLQQLRQDDSHDVGTLAFRDLVRRTLAHNACFVGQHLRVEFERNEVILRGEVQSWYHKQVAQESIRKIEGVDSIRNELTVESGCPAC